MASPLFENDHVVVLALADEPIVMIVRKPTRVELGELDRVWGAAERALAAIDRGQSCLLVDVTVAPGRNDEEFEKAFAPFRQRLSAGWVAMALVVSTLPGRLQVQRYATEDKARVSSFDNREAALAALRRAAPRK